MSTRVGRRDSRNRSARRLFLEQLEVRQLLSGTEMLDVAADEGGSPASALAADGGDSLVSASSVQSNSDAFAMDTGGAAPTAANVAPVEVPAAPHNLATTAVSPSEIHLTWDLGDAADTELVIERRTGDECPFETLVTLPGGEHTFTDTNGWAATTYTYRIKAINAAGESGYSDQQTATTLAVPSGALAVVADLQAVPLSPNAASISFTDPNTADAKRQYLLERSADGMAYQVVKSLGNSTSWTDAGLTPNATYYYRIRGVSWANPTSDYSTAVPITMPDRLPGAPIEPSALQVVEATATRVTLTWTNNDPSHPAFKIERQIFSPWHPRPWVQVGLTAPGATSFTDTDSGLKPESAYVYRVSATNEQADSGYAVPANDVMRSLFGDGLAVITASAGTGSPQVYNIGPGQTYENIADLDWSTLGPGDTVNIHYKPGGYRELFMISTRGTAQDWITINGVPDPITGEFPILDGLEAVLNPQFTSSYAPLHGSGVIIVGTRPGYVAGYRPGYVTIQNLQIQRCYAGNEPNTFTDYDGASKAYELVGAGIYLYRADHITIRNNIITDNGEGIFGAGQSGFDRLMTDITISSNSIHNNGNIGSNRTHNTYLEAIDTIYEFNHYGPTRSGSSGTGLKDRSVGVVIRGNHLQGGSHELQLPAAQNQADLAVTLPRYHRALVYGNLIIDGPGSLSGPIEYGGENHLAFNRKGLLYLYQNTIVTRSDKTVAWRVNAVGLYSTGETLDARNNIFAAIPAPPEATPSQFGLLGVNSYADRQANAYFGRNWVPPGYQLNGYGDAGFKGHVAGLENLLVGESLDPGFLNLLGGDYRLAAESEGTDQAARLAGTTLAFPADQQYLFPHRSTARPLVGDALDLGAFEYGTYPPITPPGDQQHTAGDQVQVLIVAFGADSFTASGLPPGLTIDHTGLISGTIDIQGAGTYAVLITASESGANSTASLTWIVDEHPSNVNQPPTGIILSAATVIEKTPAAAIGLVTVSDPNEADLHTLTVSDPRFEIVAQQLKLKPGVSLDQETEPTVTLDITATDSGELSWTQAFVITVVRPILIDDGELGYAEAGPGWYNIGWWKNGYQSDSRFVKPGNGQSTATWQQSLAPGSYTIQASWIGYHNNVSDAPYRIYDGDTLLAEVRVDQKRTPSYAPHDPAPFFTLATVEIASGTVRVVLGNDATGGIQVLADAVRIVPGAIAPPPSVVAGPGLVDDGEAGYTESDYGWYNISWWTKGYRSDSRFTLAGDGRSTATWQQSLAPGSYTIQASWIGYHNNVSDAPYRIYDGDTLLAEVRVDQKRTPTYSPEDAAPFLTLATVDITSGTVRVVLGNDATGGTLVFADAVRILPGTLSTPPSVIAGPALVDDGEAGYTESEYGWYSIAWWTKGYQSDSRFALAGDGRSTATWQQTLAPGRYTIQASWFGYHNNVSDAPYRIYDGDTLIAEVRVDQKQTPASAPGDPVPFLTLAALDISSGIVRVVLGNDATGGSLVVADAVRILPDTIASPLDAARTMLVAASPAVAEAEVVENRAAEFDSIYGQHSTHGWEERTDIFGEAYAGWVSALFARSKPPTDRNPKELPLPPGLEKFLPDLALSSNRSEILSGLWSLFASSSLDDTWLEEELPGRGRRK